jgi:hypothetical protein
VHYLECVEIAKVEVADSYKEEKRDDLQPKGWCLTGTAKVMAPVVGE